MQPKVTGATPRCPYCGAELQKEPERKTKCRSCGEFILVRTRPKDGARVIVTSGEAEEIRRDWEIVAGARMPTLRGIGYEEYQIEQVRDSLAAAFSGSPPTDEELLIAAMQKGVLDSLAIGRVGSARNYSHFMADFLVRGWDL